ncbi:MAG: hypothetical protein KDI37_12290, partial [Xanthomonadales bacterium]|nr:hypothetical protein [Xanthomonadales bacterium]
MRVTSAAELDLQGIVRPGDHVVWGQATGEPQALTERLVAQRSRLGPLSVFVGATFSDTLQVDRVDGLSLSGYGAIGTLAPLARSGQLQIVPCHVGQIARYIQDGRIGCDVAFVQVSPPGPDGRCSYGVIHDYTPAAVAAARTVVAEFNEQVPWTHGSASLGPEQIDLAVHSSRPVLSVPPAPIGELER